MLRVFGLVKFIIANGAIEMERINLEKENSHPVHWGKY